MFEKLVNYGISLQTKTITNIKTEIRRYVKKQFVNATATPIHLILNWRFSQFVVEAKNVSILSNKTLVFYRIEHIWVCILKIQHY